MRRRFTFALIDARTIGARSTTHYVAGGGYEVATTGTGTRTAKLYVGSSAVVIDTEQLPGQHTIVTNYLLRDHLGSCPVFEVRIHPAANSSANFENMRDTRIIE